MKSFFKQIAASFFGSCFSIIFLSLALFFGAIALGVGIVTAIMKSAESGGNATTDFEEKPALLVIDLSRGFSDAPTFSQANVPDVFSNEKGRYGLLDTLRALEFAENDDSIAGVLLLGGTTNGELGYATILELGHGFFRFKKYSEKPIFSYLLAPSFKEYFLAATTGCVTIHPFSELPLNGISSSGLYFKNLLDTLGIGVQITRVGTHKSAVEPLISDVMSPEDRAQRERIVNAIWNNALSIIAKDLHPKDISEEDFLKNLKTFSEQQGILLTPEAFFSKFVNGFAYESDLLDQMKEMVGEDEETHSFRQISLENYLRKTGLSAEPKLQFGTGAAFAGAFANALKNANAATSAEKKTVSADESEPALAVVFAEGEIVDGEGSANEVGGAWFSRELRRLRDDDSVKAVVLRVNSPGGSVFASEQIRHEAELLAQKKTLVVSMGDCAASGGYWISTPAKKIFASPLTITGSIGVFGVLFNFENTAKKIGIGSDAVLSSPLAEMNTLRRAKTPEEMLVFQDATNRIYSSFLEIVSDARGMKIEDVDAIAQGQVWLGTDAKELNLVDEIGGLAHAIAFAKKDAGLDENAPFIYIPGEVNRFDELLQMFEETTDAPVARASQIRSAVAAEALLGNGSAAGEFLKSLEKAAARLRVFNDPAGIYARLPFDADFE